MMGIPTKFAIPRRTRKRTMLDPSSRIEPERIEAAYDPSQIVREAQTSSAAERREQRLGRWLHVTIEDRLDHGSDLESPMEISTQLGFRDPVQIGRASCRERV